MPVLGLGCGVFRFGITKSLIKNGVNTLPKLLKALEYRVMTVQEHKLSGKTTEITLLKDVSAPNTLVKT